MNFRRGALASRYKRVMAASFLAAHVAYRSEGFRQRDVKFFFDLFYAWCWQPLGGGTAGLENMQFARALTAATGQGITKLKARKARPTYGLTRGGVVWCVEEMVAHPDPTQFAENLFVVYFIKNYRQKIFGIAESAHDSFPPHIAAELRALLDTSEFITQLRKQSQRSIDQLREYATRCGELSLQARSMRKRGATLDEIASFLEQTNPYQLNNQKPLDELYSELPPDVAEWELVEGPGVRAKQLWAPMITIAESYQRALSEASRGSSL